MDDGLESSRLMVKGAARRPHRRCRDSGKKTFKTLGTNRHGHVDLNYQDENATQGLASEGRRPNELTMGL